MKPVDVFVLLYVLLVATHMCLPIPIFENGTFDCSALASTPLSESDGSLQALFDICEADVFCAKRSGIEGGGTLATFEQFLEQVKPFGPGLLTVESAVRAYLCDKAVEEVFYDLFVDRISVKSFEVVNCPADHVYIPTKDRCRPSLVQSQNETWLNVLQYSVLFLVIVILGFLAAKNCFSRPSFRPRIE